MTASHPWTTTFVMSTSPFSRHSPASTPAADLTSHQRRIKLTIRPLKRSETSTPSVSSQGRDGPTTQSAAGPSHTKHSITIKPLKLKPSRSTSISEIQTPSVGRDEEIKSLPKIKLKPPRPSPAPVVDVPADTMDVDEVAVDATEAAPQEDKPVDVVTSPPPAPMSRPSKPPPPPKPKVPRPVKLKPLKEVLQRLITQIKR